MGLVEFVHRDPFMQVISRVALLRDTHGVRVGHPASRTIAITLNTHMQLQYNTIHPIMAASKRDTQTKQSHQADRRSSTRSIKSKRLSRVSVGCLCVWCCSWFLRSSCCCCLVAWLRRYLSRGRCLSLVSTISWFESSSVSHRCRRRRE